MIEASGNRIQRQNPPLGQDSKELGGRPRSERTGRRPVALEADVPQFVSGGFHLPEQKRAGSWIARTTGNRFCTGLERELELPKLTFQVIRRTIATLAQKKGTVKDIQGVLRHSRIATTTDVYMQEIPESVQRTVDAISAELRLLPNLEEVTRGTNVLLPNASKLEKGKSVSI
jgi:integrase